MNKTNFFRASAEDFKNIPGAPVASGACGADTKNAKVAKKRKGGRARTPVAPR